MCDTLAALGDWTKNGELIFAKNSDREYYEAQYVQSVPACNYGPGEKIQMTYVSIDQAPRTKAVILSRPHWMWGAEMGANEDGLVIGNEALFARVPASADPGVIGMDLVRLALERTQSVNEAIGFITDMLRQYGQSGNCGYKEECIYHNSFLLVDPNGAAILETVDREWVVRDVENYDAISNVYTIENDYVSASESMQSFAAEQNLLDESDGSGFKSVFEDPKEADFGERRRKRSLDMLEERKGQMTVQDAFQMLRDHGEQGGKDYWEARLCLHMQGKYLDATTSSMVSAVSKNAQIHWVTGSAAACTSIFKPTVVGVDIPDHGPSPGKHDDGRSLWWRHEAIRNHVLAAKEDVVHKFSCERDALESKFVDMMDGAAASCDGDLENTFATAIGQCWSDALGFEQKWFEIASRSS